MKIIVQKFGGTSVANTENREKVSCRIIEKYKAGYKVVVVVSAIGRKGDPYATDSLIELVDKDVIGKRELDLLMSCGEVISAVVLSNLLNQKGYQSTVLTGNQAGIHTNDDFGNAEIIEINPQKIVEAFEEYKIVIVTGFQGCTEDGNITTLGRGGSDTSAVVLGTALKCSCVEIYTDVDGIMTADPRIVPEARLIKTICYSEVYQLAEGGANIIHPRAVEFAERGNIEIKIKNTLKDCDGTIITSKKAINPLVKYNLSNTDKLITAVTYKKNRDQVILKVKDHNDYSEDILKKLTENKISIDLINFFLEKKIFTVDANELTKLEKILNRNNYYYEIVRGCCKLSVIGHRIRGIPGVMARIVTALKRKNIEILQTADSHTTIWCLIKEKDAETAVNELHKEFQLNLE